MLEMDCLIKDFWIYSYFNMNSVNTIKISVISKKRTIMCFFYAANLVVHRKKG